MLFFIVHSGLGVMVYFTGVDSV